MSERDEPAHKPPFLALYLRHAGKTCTAEAKEAWHKAVAAVFTYYATHRADRWKALVQMQEAVLAYIRARGAMIFHDWIGIGDTTRCAYRVSCPVCRTPAHADVVSFVAFGFEPRRLTTCPCCGIVEDAPLSNDLVLRRHGSRSFELLGTHPDRLWRGDLHLASKDRSLSCIMPWPGIRRASQRARVEGPWPRGLVLVSCVLMRGTALTLLHLETLEPQSSELKSSAVYSPSRTNYRVN